MSATAPPKLPRGTTLRAARSFDVGTVLDNKYRIEAVLGRGGMAVVVAATHVSLRQNVAIKLLLPDALSSPAVTARVLREARAAVGLTSENVTKVLDVDALDSGEPYIVMERLDGLDLGRLLAENGPLAVADVATFLVQASDAIAEAHAKGIIHRDLKPGNLFLTKRPDGTRLVKLMDFGISKMAFEDPAESLTQTTDSLGTPHYMSPEQLTTSRGVDTRTDIWALGVIVYRLLTGDYPFTGETVPAVHIAVASAETPRLRAKRGDVPAEIEELVDRCLTKSRDFRLSSVQSFAAALLPYADADTRRRYAHLAAFGRRGLSRRGRRVAMGLAMGTLFVMSVAVGAKAVARHRVAAAAAATAPVASSAVVIAAEPALEPSDVAPIASAPSAVRSASSSLPVRRRPARPAPAAPEPSRAVDPYGERR